MRFFLIWGLKSFVERYIQMYRMALPFQGLQAKKKNQIIAIDLGSRTTKGLYLQRRGNGYECLNYTLQDTPPPEKGAPTGKLAEHLKKVVQDLNAHTKQVVFTLGVGDCVLRHAELPLIPVADMRQMLKFSSKNYLQQDLPDHLFDCFILPPRAAAKADAGKAPAKGRVLVGAAKRQMVTEMANVAKAAGLVAEMITPALVGPTNAFELAQPEAFAKEIVALVDIGFRNTTISVLENGELLLTRVVGIGGDKITGGLAESLGVSYAEAEGMKLGMREDLQVILMSLLVPLGKELRDSIDFFHYQNDKTVNQVFLCGGSARSEFVVKTLKDELMLETKTWNPLAAMTLSLPPQKMGEVEQVAPQLAVAVGAALAAF